MSALIEARPNGVEIRMFRAGHGDCFLLTFRKDDGAPFHMLIDCGIKSGSEVHDNIGLPQIIDEIHTATGGVLDVVVVTHEHQDHVSGFPNEDDTTHPFQRFTVRELWLAWTEDAADADANRFRALFGDQLLTLALASHKLSQTPGADGDMAQELAEFLALEIGDTPPLEFLENAAKAVPAELRPTPMGVDAADDAFDAIFGARTRIRGARYKRRLQGLRRMAGPNIRFLSPGDGPISLPGVPDLRIYPFGPPRELDLLKSLDPRKGEDFHASPFAAGAPGAELFAALSRNPSGHSGSPFAAHHAIPEVEILGPKPKRSGEAHRYLYSTYATKKNLKRRIDGDWLQDAEALALRINNEVNNTSLVLAFELVRSGQVLLFTGDAQRGSWKSWTDLSWHVSGRTVTAKELLGRCTFYKVGHHGSHNATLNGTIESTHPNLDWMARGKYAAHFVAMIPTNKVWAFNKTRPWQHPLKSIEEALYAKAQSRVMMINDPDPFWRAPWDGPGFKEMRDAFAKRTPAQTPTCITHWVPDVPL